MRKIDEIKKEDQSMGSSQGERPLNEKQLFSWEKVTKMTSKMVIFPKEIKDRSKRGLGAQN